MKKARNSFFYIGGGISLVMTLLILMGYIWTPYSPTQMDASAKMQAPSLQHLLGTDNFGRDIFSRVLQGAGTSFLIAVSVVAIGCLAGILVGSLCGYYGGTADVILTRVCDSITAFPSILLALVFSVISIKRIVLLSAGIACVLGWLLRCLPREAGKKATLFLCGLCGIGAYVYVWLIGNGLFNWLTDMGINTMARVYMYEDMRQYYELNITYIGRGLGFVTKMIQMGDITTRVGVSDIHNDFLRQYIEQGFAGFMIWAFGLFFIRVGYFMKRNIDHGIIVFAIIFNSYITYLTDNTYVLFFPNITVALAVMAYEFDKQAEKERAKLCRQ